MRVRISALSVGLLTLVATATGVMSFAKLSAQSASSAERPLILTQQASNLRLNVVRKSGNCPPSVNLWAMMVPLEGGADHTVVMDTRAIAANTRITKTSKKIAEYEATLKPNYRSCVGQASSPQISIYSVQFRQGKAYFQVQLPNNSLGQVVSTYLTAGNPYVFWQARD